MAVKENVWDYPRPPKLEAVRQRLRVIFAGETIAETTRGFRVLETSHPPTYYIPKDDLDWRYIEEVAGQSFCEFKGMARYYALKVDDRRSERAAWCYPNPVAAYAPIAGAVAFYASAVDECWVGDEKVIPQAGDFYGGWITSNIEGPMKGPAGTEGW